MLSDRCKNQLSVLGLVFRALDVAFAHFGINRVDPSYAWLPATIATFILFDRIEMPDGIGSRAIGWVAKRSYSICLLQLTTIEIAVALVCTTRLGGGVMMHPALIRIAVWVLVTVFAYAMALGVVSVVDSFTLAPMQCAAEKAATSTAGLFAANRSDLS